LPFSALAFPDADIFAPATPSRTRFRLCSRPSRLPYPHALVKAPVSEFIGILRRHADFPELKHLQTCRAFPRASGV